MASIISTKTSGGGGIAVTGDTSGIMQLASNDGTTAVTIDASQNVGIGTASPAGKLGVSDGTVQLVTSPYGAGSTGYFGTSTNHSLAFLTNSAERMRIDSSGSVFINTTSTPADAATYLGIINAGGSNYGIAIKNSNTSTDQAIGFFNSSGTRVGSVSFTTTATAFNTSSDYRLKENVVPMTGALEVVSQLNPVTYTWKLTGEDSQGFIAHELQAVVPDCVTGEKDAVDAEGNPVYQGIDTSFLVATLTAAIQELKARIEVLEAK